MVGKQGDWNRGKVGLQHHSEETKRKIGQHSKEVALKQITEGKRKGLFKKGYTRKVKFGHSVDFNDYCGKKNPNWKEGKFVGRNKKLREEIRKRDEYRCQQCFRHQDELGRKLDVHHIDFNKNHNDSVNLISLCVLCHAQTNYNRKDWVNYFSNVMHQRGIK